MKIKNTFVFSKKRARLGPGPGARVLLKNHTNEFWVPPPFTKVLSARWAFLSAWGSGSVATYALGRSGGALRSPEDALKVALRSPRVAPRSPRCDLR